MMARASSARALLLAVAALGVAGCGSAPPAPSRIERDAVAMNERAARAFRSANYDQARSLYTEALRLDESIDNADGAAVNLLNLARVEQAAGRADAAHALLDRVLAEGTRYPASSRAEAAARKAQLALAGRDLPATQSWVETGLAHCGSGCPAAATLYNLAALAALERSAPASATEQAQKALAIAKDEGGRSERANALRILGRARLAQGDAAGARQHLSEALGIDQALGLPERIFSDLVLLGDASLHEQRRDEAKTFYERALSVGSAHRDEGAQRIARGRLSGQSTVTSNGGLK
jgi:tetratricopeptide (TPR) repeat protein